MLKIETNTVNPIKRQNNCVNGAIKLTNKEIDIKNGIKALKIIIITSKIEREKQNIIFAHDNRFIKKN